MTGQILHFPAINRSQWSALNEYCFDHLIADGMSARDAAARIEAEIADQRESKLLPEADRLLFLARRALHRLPKRS